MLVNLVRNIGLLAVRSQFRSVVKTKFHFPDPQSPFGRRGTSTIIPKALRAKNEMPSINRSLFICPVNTPICEIDCSKAFDGLTDKEKKYAHYLSKASFDGSLIVFCQVSPESPALMVLLYRLFSNQSIDSLKKKALELGWSEEEFTKFLAFASSFFHCYGNYHEFGDSKIVPDIDKEKFRLLIENSVAAGKYANFKKHYEIIEEKLFLLDKKHLYLGFPDKGVTSYHSKHVTKCDSDSICDYLKLKGLEMWNTRLIKEVKDGELIYTVRFASTLCDDRLISKEKFNDATVVLERCDFAPLLSRVISSLTQAIPFCANENQEKMLHFYIKHFEKGDIDEHKNGSRFWIKDKEPSVEFYIGFIENYRDPAGTRSEFEGFVAAVNRDVSKKFQELVDKAETLLERMPWGKDFEKDAFLKPDFTAIDVIAFGGSGIPAGINIPNYDEIRQNEGFKNVALSNVMSAIPNVKINFLDEEDQVLFKKYRQNSFEVQVGLHELYGHGSGKLLQKNADGSFNFDQNMRNILTGEPINNWYEPGQSWASVFGDLNNPYEECRAEAVGYFLSTYPDVLKIFGYEGAEAEDVKYVNWLMNVRSGLLSLEHYSPSTKKWGQAHSHANYVLMQVCLQADNDFIKITEVKNDDGKPDLLFKLDRTKINTIGKEAIAEFLRKLQVYKSTADYANGSKLFAEVGAIDEKALHWRDIVIARRQPRLMFVQPNTIIEEKGDVVLKKYPATFQGVINSFVDRYSPEAISDLESVWLNNLPLFSID